MSINHTAIRHARIVTENGIIKDGTVVLGNGKIDYVGTDEHFCTLEDYKNIPVIDFSGDWLLPGFVDIHVHGGAGHDFMEADEIGLQQITRFHGQHGTTAMLATTVTAPKVAIDRVLDTVKSFQKEDKLGASIIGVHLEGPFLSKKYPGAQNPNHMTAANIAWLEEWYSTYPGLIRMMTLAPEITGGFQCIEWLKQHNIVAACGHTDATYEEIMEAKKHGLSHAVHTFNAMKGLHHREPGTVGAILTDHAISCEIIADGHHVHPACIDLLSRVKDRDHLILITDAMAAAGMSDGHYTLGDLEVVVSENVARLKNGGSLAGSTLTMIQAFRYMVEKVGVSIADASRMASGAPAKLLNMEHNIGSIAVGKKADLIRLDSKLRLKSVWNAGCEL